MGFDAIRDAVINGDAPGVESGVQEALASGTGADDLLYNVLIPAMGEVGRRYEQGEFFVPEMLVSALAMKAGLALLRPLLAAGSSESKGVVVIGTVKGDLHDIGKNLVALMMEGAGFEVRDLGVDVDAAKFIQAVTPEVRLVALSALLTTTMPAMKATIEALAGAGLRSQVKIMVGGAPVTQTFADEIGADGFAPDASSAARKAKELIA